MLTETHLLQPGQLTSRENMQVYCGLDSMVTLEAFQEVTRLHNEVPSIYNFELAIQAQYLDTMQRGFLVDEVGRYQVTQELHKRKEHLEGILNDLARAVWDQGLNPRSPQQLQSFFYDTMRLPKQYQSTKGVRRVTTNRDALEKLEVYMYARPFVAAILAIRDLGKQLSVLEEEIDNDLRFRTSYNIAGTETGRPSSSTNAFGTGGNAQNVAPGLRWVFVADPGYKLCVIDLEQVEARDVGFFCGCLFDDWGFLDACESGDLHTNNAKLVWPERAWSSDALTDRALADENFYRDFSYRDMAKRGGHLSNYMGTAWTASRALKVPLSIMEDFQARYCRGGPGIVPAFPCIPRWWQWTAEQIQTTHRLVTPFGRVRHFFGRPGDDATLREAIAFLPQSTTADRMNLGMWRVWRHMPQVQMLAQTYDSITFQYKETEDESAIITKALDLIRVELVAPNGRSYIVPGEAKVGWNWGAQVVQADIDRLRAKGVTKLPRLNPDGLAKWKASKPDQRSRISIINPSKIGGSHCAPSTLLQMRPSTNSPTSWPMR